MQQSILSKITTWLKRRDKKIVSFKLTVVMEDGTVESLVVDKVIVNDSIKSGSKVASMTGYGLDWIKKQPQRFKGVPTLYRVCGIVPERGYVYKLITNQQGDCFVVESSAQSTAPEDSKRLKVDLALYGTDWLLDGDHAYGNVYDVSCLGVTKISGVVGANYDITIPGVYLFPQPTPAAISLLPIRKQAEHNHATVYTKGEVYFGGV